MNTEQLIAKNVEKHFDGQQVLFKVESLKEHFEGLVIHESDHIEVDRESFVKVGDIDFSVSVANVVLPKEETPEPIAKNIEDIEVVVTEETPDAKFDENPIIGEAIVIDNQPNRVVSVEDVVKGEVVVGQNIIVETIEEKADVPEPVAKAKATPKKANTK